MTTHLYTILIVDDCAEDREAYCRYLSNQLVSNYKFFQSESAEEGLAKLESLQPDLILLDYLLPDLNGLEFIAELKAQQCHIPPIIMLTGQGNEIIAVEAMKNGVKDYIVKSNLTATILNNSVKNVLQQHHLKSLLIKNRQQQQLIAETALRIRQSLDLSEILNIAVKEVQLLLDCDRVVVYRFAPDMNGEIVAESVKANYTKSLGMKVIDTCFQKQGVAKYEGGEVWVVDNIYQSQLSPCHIKLLEKFQVKANAVVPILLTSSSPAANSSRLWGLLIAHQCSDYRDWENDDLELLDKLAVQLAIAINQAELLGNLQSELNNTTKLEAELERLVQILEASEDKIGLADIEGRLIWSNPAMKQIIGLEHHTNVSQLSMTDYHPAWALDVVQTRGIPTAIERGSWLGETAILTQDGQEIPVSQLIIAHKSPQGKVEYLSTVMRNLTNQKRTEKSLQERAKQLEWLNKELVKTTHLLKKRNQELDNFAYVTSHDLKAPLRAIANLATWLAEDLADQIPEENQQQLQLMQSRVKRMDGLIQGLLEYSRVGRKNTPLQTVDIGILINQEISALSPPPEFEIYVPSNMPTFKTNAVLLGQVFSNLISNAIKYHHLGAGKIMIYAKDKGDFFEFAVSDDGPGIDPQYHERIFGIFQTLQARDKIESTGIGLSIVKKIVESQGGTVRVESQLGKGAIFYFTWLK